MTHNGLLRNLALGLACGLAAAAAPAPATAQVATQDALVLRIAADTLAVENVSRTATTIDGELAGRALGRIIYTLATAPDGTASEMTLRAWPPGRTGPDAPAQDVRITLAGDSAFVEITGAAGSVTQRLATRPGALPYVNPSFGLMEQVLRRARAMAGPVATVPLFFVQGGQTMDATVTWAGADSVVIVVGGSEMHAALAPDGRILRAAVPAQGLTVERVAGVRLPPPAVEPPDYSAPPHAPYTAEHVTITTPAGHVLAGTLTRPVGSEPVPAIVTITGSGLQDRDQALPSLPGYRPFREVADALGRRGIAVLRMDDRGFGESGGDASTATSADLADDIRAALDYLRSRADIDARRLGLVGHSEGGLIAPKVAATDTALAAIVVIAGPSRPGAEIIAYQQRSAIDRQAALAPEARDSAFQAAQRQLATLAEHQPWMRYFLEYDPLPAALQVRRTPVLVLHGGTDLQVPAEQAAELGAALRKAGNPDVTVRVFPGINHLLLPDPDGHPAGYVRLADRNVAPAVLGALADWLADRLH
jgi:uncharacterized protein